MIMHKTFKQYCISVAVKAAVIALVNVTPNVTHACCSEPYIGSICFTAASYCPAGYLPADGRLLNISQYSALYALLGTTYGGNGTTTFALPDLRGRVPVGAGLGAGLGQNVTQGQKRGSESVFLTTAQTPLASHNHATTVANAGGGGADALVAKGRISLPLSGTVSNVPVNGSVAVNVLTTQTTNSAKIPSNTKNTVGKNGTTSQFYSYNSASAVASPATVNLNATGGTLNGTATGDVSLPVTGKSAVGGGTVTVVDNAAVPAMQAVNVLDPSLGLMACIAVEGLFPPRP